MNQTHGIIKQLVEIIRCKTRLAQPFEAQPLHVFFNRAHIFVGFFFGVGVVETQIAHAVISISKAEIEADGFGVADVQIAVGLGRKAGVDAAVFAAGEVFVNHVADKVIVGKLFFVHHNKCGPCGKIGVSAG